MQITDQTIQAYIAAVAARKSTPGGGAVAAIVAAEGCALIAMVAHFTKNNEQVANIAESALASIDHFFELADADMNAFNAVMQSYKSGEGKVEAARMAAGVPGELLTTCYQHIPHLEILVTDGNKNLITDVAIAASLIEAAMDACEFNILVNCQELEECEDLKAPIDLLADARNRLQAVRNTIRSSMR